MVFGESLSLIINELSVIEVIPMIEIVEKLFRVTFALMCKYIISLEQVVVKMEHT